jgi:site-specific DNA recombinase
VVWRLSQPSAVQLLVTDEDEVDVPALRERRRLLEARLEQLGVEFGDGDTPAATLRSATARITAQLAEIEDALPQSGKARVFEGVIGAKDVRAAFAGLDLDRRRAIIDALLTFTVQPVSRCTGRAFYPQYIDVEDL